MAYSAYTQMVLRNFSLLGYHQDGPQHPGFAYFFEKITRDRAYRDVFTFLFAGKGDPVGPIANPHLDPVRRVFCHEIPYTVPNGYQGDQDYTLPTATQLKELHQALWKDSKYRPYWIQIFRNKRTYNPSTPIT